MGLLLQRINKMKREKKRVHVTWSDIKRAECGDPLTCAIAKALNRQCKQRGWHVHSASEIQSPYYTNYAVVDKDEYKVDNFIQMFDSGEKVRPISFDLVRAE